MKQIIINVPDTFPTELMDFVKRSAMLQIEAEMRKALTVPEADVEAVNAQIDEIKTASGIADEDTEIKPI